MKKVFDFIADLFSSEIPYEKENSLLKEGKVKLLQIVEEEKEKENADRYDLNRRSRSTCPNCHKSTNIVDKITRVQGSGYVSGSFVWGTGSIHGRSKTDTTAARHCNECGNQWIPYDPSYTSTQDVLSSNLRRIVYFAQGESFFKDSFKEIKEKFKGIPAETLMEEIKIMDIYRDISNKDLLLFLRTHFRSVYKKYEQLYKP